MLENIFIFLVVFFAGFVFGWLNHAHSFLRKVMADPDEMINLLNEYKKSKPEDQKNQDTPVREIKVEKYGNALYLYAKDNDQFLAQGNTLQEALAEVDKKFPGKNFKGYLSKEDADRLGITAD